MSTLTKSTMLGDEFDETLIESIRTVLSFLGAIGDTQEWAVAGSQEIETRTLIIDGARIEIESETFIGITISGKSSAIDRVSELVSVEYNLRVTQKLSNGLSPVYSNEVCGIN